MNGIKAVIFDWAGTTVDYGCITPTKVFIEVFHKRGIDISMEEARGPMGVAKKEHVRQLLQLERVKNDWQLLYHKIPDEDDINDLYAALEPSLAEIVADYSTPIPGIVDLVNNLRSFGIKIGSTTGYVKPMMKNVIPVARELGYLPDTVITSSDVSEGRPKPWMCYLNAIELDVYPLYHCVKIGDTVADIQEGRNAGMWTIGFTKCGNEVGYTEEELESLPPDMVEELVRKAGNKLTNAGAHFVVEGPWDCMPVLEKINSKIVSGEMPD